MYQPAVHHNSPLVVAQAPVFLPRLPTDALYARGRAQGTRV